MKQSNQKVLITGGSSGIGLALAKKFLDNHNTVIITGRDLTKLEKVKSGDDNLKPMPPEKLAEAFWKGYINDKEEITPGISTLLKMLSRLAPEFIFKQLNKKPIPEK